MTTLRAALADQSEQALEMVEPVAYGYRDARGNIRPLNHHEMKMDRIPLYTAPPQRNPLTNGEIYTAYITATNQTLRAQDERLAFAFARAIERAHGIGEKA